MTREVAIRNLEMIRIAFVNPVTKEQRKLIDDTVDMAISALSENKHFDGMTNGEVIQALFPNPHIDTKSHTVWVGYEEMSFTRKWWNAPYQKGGADMRGINE